MIKGFAEFLKDAPIIPTAEFSPFPATAGDPETPPNDPPVEDDDNGDEDGDNGDGDNGDGDDDNGDGDDDC